MAIITTINATVPAGTSGDIIFYEDINSNQDGTEVDRNSRAYNNKQIISLEDGTNQYTLDNFTGGGGDEYWFDLDISNTDREAGLVVNSVEIDPEGTGPPPGTGTLEWTTETEFNNVRDEVGISTDGLGTHPSAGSAFQGYPYGDLRKELLMYFPFDDNKSTSTAQNAAHGEPGKLDTVSYSSDSLVQTRSLSFTSAGSNVSIERYPQIEVEDGVFTASVAFKVDSANVTGDVVLFGDKDLSATNDTAGFVIYLSKPSSNVNVRAAVETTGGTQRTGTTSGTNFGDNSWHVATLTKTDDDTLDMYVDGVRRFGMGSLGDITSTNEFRVGVAHDGSSNDYRGLIEEVRLYGKAFSQVEAERLYNIRSSDYQTTSNLPSATPTYRYDFEDEGDTTSVTDSQGNSDGTIGTSGGFGGSGTGVVYITDSVIGDHSLQFNGNGDEVDTNTTFDTDSDFTWAAWFKTTDSRNFVPIITNRTSTGTGFGILLDGGNIEPYLQDTDQNSIRPTVTGNINDGAWRHVAVSYDASVNVLRGYLDGVLKSEDTGTMNDSASPDNLLLAGTRTESFTYDGELDDVRIYGSTLTPSQIERIYNFQQPRLPENSMPETGLNGWLPLNESAGDAIDLAAGNDGTLNGPTQGAVGLQGTTSYSFDGNGDYVELVNDYYSLPFSVSAWAISNEALGNRRDIINFRDNLQLIIATGVNGTNTIDVWDGNWVEVGSFTANEWFHIVATIDDGGLTKIYVDGSLSAVKNLSPTNAAENRNTLGIDPNGNGPWSGRIAEVRTYRRRLRPSEIDLLYRRGNINIDQATTDPELAKFSGAVSRWSFDDSDMDGSTLTDTYGDNDGTIVNATSGVDGVGEGEAFDFNGTDSAIEVSDSPSLSGLTEFTISSWLNLDSGGSFQGIVSKGPDVSGTGSTEFKLLVASSDFVRFAISSGSTEQEITSTGPLKLSQWSHVAATWDGLNMAIYINAALAATGERASMQDTTSNLLIGANPDGSSGAATSAANFIDGKIDEVRFYNQALDSHQIWQLYSLGRNQNWVTHNE